MRENAHFHTRSSRSEYSCEVDVLSDVIAAMRAGQPRSARVVWHPPWAQQFRSVPGSAGFQVILQGTCWLLPPDGDPIRLTVGDVAFLPHGSGHALADSPSTPQTEPPCDPNAARYSQRYASATVGRAGIASPTVTLCGAYRLDPARVHPLLRDLPEVIHLPARAGSQPELRVTVDLLGAELERPRLGGDAIVPALLDTLLVYMVRTWFDEQPADATNASWSAALKDPAITAALHAIHRHPARPWTVATLAAQAGLSRAPFARRFTTLVGQPPLSYLTWWRMTTASQLLRDSDATLNAIAARIGYTSEFAFANAFKREHGTAPGIYRRSAQHQLHEGAGN
jgi:AraC-like DNA-binding protein